MMSKRARCYGPVALGCLGDVSMWLFVMTPPRAIMFVEADEVLMLLLLLLSVTAHCNAAVMRVT